MGAGGSVQAQNSDAGPSKYRVKLQIIKDLTSLYQSHKELPTDEAVLDAIEGELRERDSQIWSKLLALEVDLGEGESQPPTPATTLEEGCVDVVERTAILSSQSVIFAADQSEQCAMAFKVLMEILRTQDFVNVVHVADEANNNVIRDSFEGPLIASKRIQHNGYKVTFLPSGDSVRNTLIRYTNEMCKSTSQTPKKHRLDATLFVCGFMMKRSADGHATILGSTSDLAMRSIYTPSLIVKKPLEPKEGGGRSYILLTDGTARAFRAYEFATNSLMRPRDSVKVVHFFEVDMQSKLTPSMTLASIQEEYSLDMISRGVHGEFEAIEWQPTRPLLDTMKDYLIEAGPDFAILSPRPGNVQEKNSMSEQLISEVPVNFFVVKS